MISRLRTVLLILGVLALPIAAEAHETAPTEADLAVERLVRQVLQPDPQVRGAALSSLAERGNSDVAAGLIQAMRFVRSDPAIGRALASLTGVDHGNDWHAWMLWQQAHPEIVPFVGFDAFKADILAAVDENFRHFLWPGIAHEIRLEEITWGGVVKDGIPALINPTHIAAAEADYLTDDELVFGIEINGDARAYPLRILDWHEMANDVVGGVPLALAYCTLCGSGILFETDVAGRGQPFVFGSSGFLYRSNKLFENDPARTDYNLEPGMGPIGEYYRHADDRQAFVELLNKHGHVNDIECQFRRRDGGYDWILLSGRLITYQDQRTVLGQASIINHRKQAEELLKQAKEDAEAVAEAKSAFAELQRNLRRHHRERQ